LEYLGGIKMNHNKILKESSYHDDPRFVEIVRWCASQRFSNIGIMMDAVRSKFPAIVKIGMKESPAPFKTFFPEGMRVEDEAYNQLKMALSIPPAVKGAAMPDCHPGYSMPIGGVVALDGAVSPTFVGLDIFCSMSLTVYDVDPREFQSVSGRNDLLQFILASTSFGLGAETTGLDHKAMHLDAWNEIPILKRLKPLAQKQLGSSGGGNHFANIMRIRYTNVDPDREYLALMTHSGSRGTGKQTAEHYIQLADQQASQKYKFPKGYGWLTLDSELGQEYMTAMAALGEYAKANHDLIHNQFENLFQGEYYSSYFNSHNMARVENGLMVHRKGATPAGSTDIGIIPGSSGTNSYLVVGRGNPDSLNSASHGAGRVSSRSTAKKNFNQKEFDERMKEITFHGVNPDEGFQAYKDIDRVMEAQRDLVEIVAVMKPMVVVMGGKADDGD
jgi:tRNA-splicing ligase RtcB